jgi:hypothetical protein
MELVLGISCNVMPEKTTQIHGVGLCSEVDMDSFSCLGMWNSCPKYVRNLHLHFVFWTRNCIRLSTLVT